jgi:predicted nuclease of predicted toxin-antitoxin system
LKLLFDANLSPALVTVLGTEFPDSAHVRDVGLRSASDAEIWTYAKANEFAIVSKDTDFRERSFVEGFPPKVLIAGANVARARYDGDGGSGREQGH